MKAAVIKEPYRFTIEDHPIPEPKQGEVRIRIHSVGICGSDVHGMEADGGARRVPGLVIGHESAGQIEAVGPDAGPWKVGDRVAIDPQLSCGYCYACERGWKNLCENGVTIGSSRKQMTHGTMREYITVPTRQIYKLPDNVSFDEGATLDFVGNAVHVLNRANSKLGDTFLVIGTGAIGLIAVQLAKLRGAGKVIAVDTSPSKLKLAEQFGADRTINPMFEDVLQVVKDETGGYGADIVLEMVGLPSTYETAILAAKMQGTVMALGFAASQVTIPIQALLFSEITIVGCTGFSFEGETVLKMISDGRINVKPLITHEYPLEEIDRGFEVLRDKTADAIKVIIHP
ncbi:zinc-dependent alcohol dehydrogenase [Cohnella abietis]|uniref:Galactitol-1-phosphate 5-dehydrogenase n=1 Tax=Cohnella abietis TaxID=2507935 RepID=A0A3T1D223_9BACL|nr:zinc-binding dehydrogenase [Cohnella abietis]BBI32150.1 galactitol-1-phosphate 5-dehydrogenase [Cohnella abietis]